MPFASRSAPVTDHLTWVVSARLRRLLVAATGAAALAEVGMLIGGWGSGLQGVATACVGLGLLGLFGLRGVKRLSGRSSRRRFVENHSRVLVLGAGWLGSTLAEMMLRDRAGRFLPVGFLDDDSAKRQLRIRGLRVLGGTADLQAVARSSDASHVVVAVNKADPAFLRSVADKAREAGLTCLLLPPIDDLTGGSVSPTALRELDIDDLLGRGQSTPTSRPSPTT